MGIASGAFIGPTPSRQMTAVEAAKLSHTHGAVDELQRGVGSAYLTIFLVLVLAALAVALRARARRKRPGDSP